MKISYLSKEASEKSYKQITTSEAAKLSNRMKKNLSIDKDEEKH